MKRMPPPYNLIYDTILNQPNFGISAVIKTEAETEYKGQKLGYI